MTSQRFPKRLRLLSAKDFERVFASRVSVSDRWIVLYGETTEAGHPRLGLTVPRRVGGAVRRNRWKRMLREAFRLSQSELPTVDLVCVPRSTSPPELAQLTQSLRTLALRVEQKLQSRASAPPSPPSAIPGEQSSRAIEQPR
ncbi:MAG TPA: ribonuclease P protein component [Lacipirellulaceae bacterium]|jgi:ribonuclease P protein component|nr:ribonuclease P protein component [Lacipirellulaceae bacterium]